MKRWKTTKGKEIENEKIDTFLVEVLEISNKHGLSIAHEDRGGNFLIHKFSPYDADWLMSATDETDR